jgi:hypothetical protein
MVPDVSTGDPTRMLCLNCARRIVSPRSVSKYEGLTRYLKFRGSFTDTVKLSFARIDGIIGDNLPTEAYKSEKWWDNVSTRLYARSWLEAGWETRETNLKEGYVVFKKVREVKASTGRRLCYFIVTLADLLRHPRLPADHEAQRACHQQVYLARVKAVPRVPPAPRPVAALPKQFAALARAAHPYA